MKSKLCHIFVMSLPFFVFDVKSIVLEDIVAYNNIGNGRNGIWLWFSIIKNDYDYYWVKKRLRCIIYHLSFYQFFFFFITFHSLLIFFLFFFMKTVLVFSAHKRPKCLQWQVTAVHSFDHSQLPFQMKTCIYMEKIEKLPIMH